MNNLIIEAGESRPRYQKWADFVATVLIWAAYIYLLRGVFVFMARTLADLFSGVSTKHDAAAAAIGSSLSSYIEVIAVNSALFIAWAVYNQLMYGGRNRRKSADPVKAEEIGAFFGLSSSEVDACREARRLIVLHDRNGAIIEFQTNPVFAGGE